MKQKIKPEHDDVYKISMTEKVIYLRSICLHCFGFFCFSLKFIFYCSTLKNLFMTIIFFSIVHISFLYIHYCRRIGLLVMFCYCRLEFSKPQLFIGYYQNSHRGFCISFDTCNILIC